MSTLKGSLPAADQAFVTTAPTGQPGFQRRRKLIEPRIQIRFFLFFLTISGLAVLIQAIVLNFLMQRVARQLPSDGDLLLTHMPGLLGIGLLVTFVLLAPLTFVLGVQTTFPIVGPLYRFRVYLGQIARGESVGECHIRKGDELQDLCQSINRAVTVLQSRAAPERSAAQTAPPAADAERRAG